jgi:glycosyltransferase involved in cell wall biosynthesis
MAAGAIPVCGDLPSIREWINHESNGFLAAFDDVSEVTDALRSALKLSDTNRNAIRAKNALIIAARAERGITGRYAVDKYRGLVKECQDRSPSASVNRSLLTPLSKVPVIRSDGCSIR